MINIALIGGDGIGPEVVGATRLVLERLFPDTFLFTEISAGFEHYQSTGETISTDSLAICQDAHAILYGANTNPPDALNYSSLTLTLRRELELFANVRPAKNLPGIGKFSEVDLTIVRENSEGLYIREEEEIPGGFVAKRRVTEAACRKIISYAFELATRKGQKRVTLVHKANVLKKTCGLFRSVGLELASDYPHLEVDERFVDAMAMELIIRPEEFQVLVTTNLFGDILSDEASALVGGLGVAPGANIGKHAAVFEPVHGSAPDIAGKGIANPVATLLSATLMLQHLDLLQEAHLLERNIIAALSSGICTQDLGGLASSSEFIEAVANPSLTPQRSLSLNQPSS